MNKTYNQKENSNTYIFLILLLIAVYIFGVWLVNYHLYIVIFPAIAFIIKIIKIDQNPEVPVIKLTDTEIHLLISGKTFKYSDISSIQLYSKYSNGHIVLKETNKKEILNSVAISMEDQKEIREFILKKITE